MFSSFNRHLAALAGSEAACNRVDVAFALIAVLLVVCGAMAVSGLSF